MPPLNFGLVAHHRAQHNNSKSNNTRRRQIPGLWGWLILLLWRDNSILVFDFPPFWLFDELNTKHTVKLHTFWRVK